jgi:hypothetical protein
MTITSLNSVNQLISVMVKCGVLFEVRTGLKYYLDELPFQRVNTTLFLFLVPKRRIQLLL